jgi:hypothetical protein
MTNITFKQVVDMVQNEIRNQVLHLVSGAPSTPVEGQFWYDTGTDRLKYQATSGAIDPTARANHSGTQTASTISDFNTAVRTNTLNQMAGPTADLAIGSHKITGLTAGAVTGDAVEFDQLNTAIAAAVATATAGLSWKTPVRVGTVANIATLAGGAPNTVDGITLAANDRILVKAQSTGAQNGIYIVTTLGTGANGTWTRATDADSASELQGGSLVAIDEGSTLQDTVWMLAGDVVTIGTTSQTWTQFGAGAVYTASLGVQLVGNDIRANLGTGLTLSGNQAIPDYGNGKVFKQKTAVGYVGTSGADVTVNHGFALADKHDLVVNVVEVGVGLVQTGIAYTDVNNVVLSFSATPTTNQYRYSMVGLS